jgi:hypothetical protein
MRQTIDRNNNNTASKPEGEKKENGEKTIT